MSVSSVQCQISKTLIGGATCRRVQIGGASGRRNVRPCRIQQRTVQLSAMCLESGDGGGTFCNRAQYHSTTCLELSVSDAGARTLFGSRAFCRAAPTIWNSVHADLTDNFNNMLLPMNLTKNTTKTNVFLT